MLDSDHTIPECDTFSNFLSATCEVNMKICHIQWYCDPSHSTNLYFVFILYWSSRLTMITYVYVVNSIPQLGLCKLCGCMVCHSRHIDLFTIIAGTRHVIIFYYQLLMTSLVAYLNDVIVYFPRATNTARGLKFTQKCSFMQKNSPALGRYHSQYHIVRNT